MASNYVDLSLTDSAPDPGAAVSGSVAVTNFPSTQNVAVTTSVLPTGAATNAAVSAVQGSILDAADSNNTRLETLNTTLNTLIKPTGLGSVGVNGNLNLVAANTAYEAKVAAARLGSRKSLTVQAFDSDLYWGYNSDVDVASGTLLYKGQFIEFDCAPGSTFQVWLVSVAANKNVRIGEST